MKILFLSTNRFRIELALPMPIGLACVIGTIDETRHSIEVLDLMFSEDPAAELEARLSRFQPELVAVSIRNIDNLSYLDSHYFVPEAKRMIDLCRSSSRATIIVGGAAFSTAPEALFDHLEPDFGIVGEGEGPFPLLVERIEKGADWSDLPGLVWRSQGEIKSNPPAFLEDWSGLPLPRRDLFDAKRYAEAGGFENIVISQGCPMRCLYCDDPHRLGRKQRRKAVERAVDELESMSEASGDTPIFFTAPIFNSSRSYAKKLCRAIIERNLKIRWTALIHPAFLDDELGELMKRSGCLAVSLACDSCSESMLANLRKDISKEQLEAAIRILERNGIGYLLTILFGGPGEDRETIDETLDFLSDKNPLVVTFALGIRILPNTALAEMAVEQGLISADDPLLEPRFYLSPGVEGWAADYLNEACAKRDNWTFMLLESPEELEALSDRL